MRVAGGLSGRRNEMPAKIYFAFNWRIRTHTHKEQRLRLLAFSIFRYLLDDQRQHDIIALSFWIIIFSSIFVSVCFFEHQIKDPSWVVRNAFYSHFFGVSCLLSRVRSMSCLSKWHIHIKCCTNPKRRQYRSIIEMRLRRPTIFSVQPRTDNNLIASTIFFVLVSITTFGRIETCRRRRRRHSGTRYLHRQMEYHNLYFPFLSIYWTKWRRHVWLKCVEFIANFAFLPRPPNVHASTRTIYQVDCNGVTILFIYTRTDSASGRPCNAGK